MNETFALGINLAGSLVQHQEGRISEHRTGQRDTLALSSRESTTAFPDNRLITVGQLLFDESIRMRASSRCDDCIVRSLRRTVTNVVQNRVIEELRLLSHETHALTPIMRTQAAQIDVVNADLP